MTEKEKKLIKEGKPFNYVRFELRHEKFTCPCGQKGYKAHILRDKNGNEIAVGDYCFEKYGVHKPVAKLL